MWIVSVLPGIRLPAAAAGGVRFCPSSAAGRDRSAIASWRERSEVMRLQQPTDAAPATRVHRSAAVHLCHQEPSHTRGQIHAPGRPKAKWPADGATRARRGEDLFNAFATEACWSEPAGGCLPAP